MKLLEKAETLSAAVIGSIVRPAKPRIRVLA
jgi:hypothetical protein